MAVYTAYNTWIYLLNNMHNYLHMPKEFQEHDYYKNAMKSLVENWITTYDPTNTIENVWEELKHTAINQNSINALMYIH